MFYFTLKWQTVTYSPLLHGFLLNLKDQKIFEFCLHSLNCWFMGREQTLSIIWLEGFWYESINRITWWTSFHWHFFIPLAFVEDDPRIELWLVSNTKTFLSFEPVRCFLRLLRYFDLILQQLCIDSLLKWIVNNPERNINMSFCCLQDIMQI